MAIEHMDNFSLYGSTAALMLNGIYAQNTSASLPTDPDGLSGGRVLKVDFPSGSSRGTVRYPFTSGAQTTSGIGLRVWLDALPSASDMHPCFISWRDGSNVALYSLTVGTTGNLQLRSGDYNGSIVAETTGPVITANGWWHIEARLFSNSSGNIEVRVEGIPVIDYDADTAASVASQVSIINDPTTFGFGVGLYIKDFVVWNGTGSLNNDFLGSVLVTSLLPASDVALNWTPSTGSDGYSILDNVPPNDAQYLSAGDPPPAAYVCSLTNLPDDVTSVKALMTMVRAAKSDGGDGSLQTSLISNGDTANGANRPITVAQTYWRDVFETDPDTAAPWLPSAVDAANMQINRTT